MSARRARSALVVWAMAAIVGAVGPAWAQEPQEAERPTASTGPMASGPRTSADEEFELNIDERRITEADYEASTMVEIRPEQEGQGIALRVGALVRARQIDVLLRGVRGRVRFFASLEDVLRRIESHRAVPPGP